MTDEELREIFEQSKTRTRTNLEKLRAQMRIRTDQPRFSFVRHYAERDKRFDRLAETVTLLGQKVDRDLATLRREMKRGFNLTRRKR
jgi:hypothetical protein